MKKTFALFLLKCVLLILPFLALLGLYFYDDPFEVLHEYKTYYKSPVAVNEGFVGWQYYRMQRDSVKYNSFLLGNSCTMAFQAKDWEKHLPGGRAIRLYGSAERLGNIYWKVRALDAVQDSIKNVLILLDYATLKQTQVANISTQVLHPEISGQNNWEFQMCFLQTFFNPDFCVPYVDFRLFRQYRRYMRGVINDHAVERNCVSNDVYNPREKEIAALGESYWERHKKEFPARDTIQKVTPPIIMKKQYDMLSEMRDIFVKRGTNYKILINPKYNQVKLNPDDLKQLQEIFGKENVFDFSGINEYTADIHNYYEKGHYRPQLGRKMLDVIYGTIEN